MTHPFDELESLRIKKRRWEKQRLLTGHSAARAALKALIADADARIRRLAAVMDTTAAPRRIISG